jgi:hypothetical protein
VSASNTRAIGARNRRDQLSSFSDGVLMLIVDAEGGVVMACFSSV